MSKFKWDLKTGEVKFGNGKTIQLEANKPTDRDIEQMKKDSKIIEEAFKEAQPDKAKEIDRSRCLDCGGKYTREPHECKSEVTEWEELAQKISHKSLDEWGNGNKSFIYFLVKNMKEMLSKDFILKKELREMLEEKDKPHTYSSENADEYIKYCDIRNDFRKELKDKLKL